MILYLIAGREGDLSASLRTHVVLPADRPLAACCSGPVVDRRYEHLPTFVRPKSQTARQRAEAIFA